jgi:hypothetical protein
MLVSLNLPDEKGGHQVTIFNNEKKTKMQVFVLIISDLSLFLNMCSD